MFGGCIYEIKIARHLALKKRSLLANSAPWPNLELKALSNIGPKSARRAIPAY